MSKNNNIITINGKDYDVLTGAPLDGSAQHKHKSKVADKQPAVVTKSATVTKNAPTAKKARSKAKNVAPHSPKSATTLMRKAVKKPTASQKSVIKATGTIQVEKKVSHGSVNSKLQSYASRVHRSPLIKHFSNAAPSDIAKQKPANVSPKKTQDKPKPIKKKPKTTAELLDYAIAQSTSHEQAPLPKKSRNPLKRKS